MPKDKQNVYRAMLHGLMELSDEFLIPQVPTTDGNWLYDVFFQLRLDHPEIFWAVGFKYRYYKDSGRSPASRALSNVCIDVSCKKIFANFSMRSSVSKRPRTVSKSPPMAA